MDVVSLLRHVLATVSARAESAMVDAVFWWPGPPTRQDDEILRFGIINSMKVAKLTWGDAERIILALEDFYIIGGFPSGLIWYANDSRRGELGMGMIRAPKQKSTAKR